MACKTGVQIKASCRLLVAQFQWHILCGIAESSTGRQEKIRGSLSVLWLTNNVTCCSAGGLLAKLRIGAFAIPQMFRSLTDLSGSLGNMQVSLAWVSIWMPLNGVLVFPRGTSQTPHS